MILTMLVALTVACSDNSNEKDINEDVTLGELKQAVVDVLGENYWPNAIIPPDTLKVVYGVSEDMYEEALAEMPMISANVDTMILIRAKADKVEEVEKALNEYRDKMINDTMQYPMNVGKIQASRIETFGNFVCFIQLGGDTMEVSENGDEAVIRHCQQENEKALDAIGKIIAGENNK